MKNPGAYSEFTTKTIAVIEDQVTQQSYESEPYPMGTALDLPCVCGARIHPIVGAWCTKCGATVIQIRVACQPVS